MIQKKYVVQYHATRRNSNASRQPWVLNLHAQSEYKDYLLKQWESFPINFTTSSVKKTGLKEIVSFIDENNIQFKY